MAGRYGGWDDRPWERKAGSDDDWGREQEMRARREQEHYGERSMPRDVVRRERDRPWVEPSPDRRPGQETRGLMEWEDRGPLAWLRDKTREMKNRGAPPRGPKGYKRTDERIVDDVCERIARSGVRADDVEVKVEKGEVTLTGTVWNREEKWWVEALVEDAYGVEEVHNRLRISRPGSSDENIEKDDVSH